MTELGRLSAAEHARLNSHMLDIVGAARGSAGRRRRGQSSVWQQGGVLPLSRTGSSTTSRVGRASTATTR